MSSSTTTKEETKTTITTTKSSGGNFLTRRKFFQTMVTKAFNDCDTSSSGEVDKQELYAGLLLVHLKLAKFAGAAACYVSYKNVL